LSRAFVEKKKKKKKKKEGRRKGSGIIIKDSKSQVLTTLCEPKDHTITFKIAEAIAALRTVNFSRDLGFYKVILEGDCVKIVQALGKDCSN
jgi:hypothetical protein